MDCPGSDRPLLMIQSLGAIKTQLSQLYHPWRGVPRWTQLLKEPPGPSLKWKRLDMDPVGYLHPSVKEPGPGGWRRAPGPELAHHKQNKRTPSIPGLKRSCLYCPLLRHVTYQPLPHYRHGLVLVNCHFPNLPRPSHGRLQVNKRWPIEGANEQGFPKDFCFSSGPKTVQIIKQGHCFS